MHLRSAFVATLACNAGRYFEGPNQSDHLGTAVTQIGEPQAVAPSDCITRT